MKNLNEKLFSINWKAVKQLLDNNKLTAIGSNYRQVNNQGEFTINESETKIFKRRHTSVRAHYDLIATS